MLTELVVRDLGVIEDLGLLLGGGMTALTGETGAGKTLLVGAIELLLGGRADPTFVRQGAAEARVDGRFDSHGVETVLTRVVSRQGRSRAYVDGLPVTVTQLSEVGRSLVDLHGQHAHQTLLMAAAQRAALDDYGAVDRTALVAARQQVRDIDDRLVGLGGDERVRNREIDLLRFQVAELEAAELVDPDEDAGLKDEEELLADAVAHRDAAVAAVAALHDDGAALDLIAAAVTALQRRRPYEEYEQRLRSLAAELTEVVTDLRAAGERIDNDPARQQQLRSRRQLLRDLQRKYGEDVAALMTYRNDAQTRLQELESHEQRARELDSDRTAALAVVRTAADVVRAKREATSGPLANAVQRRLHDLAMPKARVHIETGSWHDEMGANEGGDVRFMLAANSGGDLLPLSKVASGGELARSMLALRLALLEGRVALGGIPATLVFDEVDAGIGGQAAVAVGQALAELGRDRQVLVVTHLPQVAAQADAQMLVTKSDHETLTRTAVMTLDRAARVVELSRMLAGHPESSSGRLHAEELLDEAARRAGPTVSVRKRGGRAARRTKAS